MIIDTDHASGRRSPKRLRPSSNGVENGDGADAMDIDRDPSHGDHPTLANATAQSSDTANRPTHTDPTALVESAAGVAPAVAGPGSTSADVAPPPPPPLPASTGGPAGQNAPPPRMGTLTPTGKIPDESSNSNIGATNAVAPTTPNINSTTSAWGTSPGDQIKDQSTGLTPTRGASVGTQVDKTTDLTTDSTQLELAADRTGVVEHCAWNPTDATCLFTAGSEALCRVWTLSGTAPRPPPSSSLGADGNNNDANGVLSNGINGTSHSVTVSSTHLDLRAADHDSWMVSTAAWSDDGAQVAVGVCGDDQIYDGQVTIWTKSGGRVNTLSLGQDAILCLRWDPTGDVLLGICAGLDHNTIKLWSPRSANLLATISIDEPLEDAFWVNSSTFGVAGGPALKVYRFDGQHTELTHTYAPPEHRDLWMVKYDQTSSLVLTCSHGNTVDIWDQSLRLQTLTPHTEQITALEWQPLPAKHTPSDPRLFATSSLDGRVRIHSSRRPFSCVHTFTFSHPNRQSSSIADAEDEQVLALAFSPSGAYIAAVNAYGLILIWHVVEGGLPKASWWGGARKSFRDALMITNGNGNATENTNGHGTAERLNGNERDDEADHHNLSWSAAGGRLAYTLNRQVMSSLSLSLSPS